MTFEIVLSGEPHGPVRGAIADLVGADRLRVEEGHLVVSLPDQAAAVGVLRSISGLGCDVDTVRRCSEPSSRGRAPGANPPESGGGPPRRRT